MKRLIPLIFLTACSQAAAPPASAPEPAAAPAEMPAPQAPSQAPEPTTSASAPAPAPAKNSPEEARDIARAYLQAKYPGRHVEVGAAGDMQGAAGSIYIEIPATVGDLSGTVVVRRVNDVDGSTAEQRRWHVQSDDLK